MKCRVVAGLLWVELVDFGLWSLSVLCLDVAWLPKIDFDGIATFAASLVTSVRRCCFTAFVKPLAP